MTPTIRVVVADDSDFVRGLITSYLESSDLLEVVGAAADGAQAVELVTELRPDVVTLDVDMPNMSGMEALGRIMREVPTPAVMVSGVSLNAADITLQAIQSGAVDFILKYVPGVNIDPETLRLDVISKVRAAAGVKVVRAIHNRLPAASRQLPLKGTHKSAFRGTKTLPSADLAPRALHASRVDLDRGQAATDIVVIGASTGGPTAVKELLARLPADFPAPVLVVQHIPHPFTEVLAAQLNNYCSLTATVAQGGERCEPGQVYIAPGDKHLLLSAGMALDVHDGPEIAGHRPSIDIAMKSVAQYFPHRVYGVLLTGMGEDGAGGMAYIRARGGSTFAQSADTCVVNGMPQRAIDIGAVDFVASPEAIADRLTHEVMKHTAPRTQKVGVLSDIVMRP